MYEHTMSTIGPEDAAGGTTSASTGAPGSSPGVIEVGPVEEEIQVMIDEAFDAAVRSSGGARTTRGLRVLFRARDRELGWRDYRVDPFALSAFTRGVEATGRRVVSCWREDWDAYQVTVHARRVA